MTRQPLEFTPESALKAITRSGYCHVSSRTPRELLTPFLLQHGLDLNEDAAFTVTLVPSGHKGSNTDWNRIRKEQMVKREKAAVRAKKKEQK